VTGADTPVQPDDAQMLAGLREAREFLNLSQQFVAEQTRIPRSAISARSRVGAGVRRTIQAC